MSIPLTPPSRWWRVLFFARPRPSHPSPDMPASTAEETLEHFETFFMAYERQITAYLCRMTGDEQTAHDLSQETFVQAWKHFPQLQEAPAARAWLYRVATNLALNLLRRHHAHPEQAIVDELPGASDPGRRVAERDHVQQVLLLLSPKQRSALILHEVYGLSCEEVGQSLGISRDAVKMALLRGRETFRAHYLREDDV